MKKGGRVRTVEGKEGGIVKGKDGNKGRESKE